MDVPEGPRGGGCGDNVNPPVRFNLDDEFWRVNGNVEPQPANQGTGCGFDMTAFPGIVRLGGWDGQTTSLAYRELGFGRVWLVEADWQDGEAGFTAASVQLMRHMVLHGAWTRGLNLPGIQQSLAAETVAGGDFRECHRSRYTDRTPLADIRAACDGDVLLLACRPVGSTRYTLAAMGRRDEVLRDVGPGIGDSHAHNGLSWYFDESTSWGFLPAGARVARATCDVDRADRPEQRLCWHTENDTLAPGYRCGGNFLNGDAGWERVVLHRPGPLADRSLLPILIE